MALNGSSTHTRCPSLFARTAAVAFDYKDKPGERGATMALARGEFDESVLEPHLRMNIRLLDRDGRGVLAESPALPRELPVYIACAVVGSARPVVEEIASANAKRFLNLG